MQTVAELPQTSNSPVPLEIETDAADENAPHVHRWTKAEYYRLNELGFFDNKRTELIEGEIIEMPTMKSSHATALALTHDVLRTVFAQGFVVRNQMPLDMGENSELVPDVAIVEGKARDFKESHPQLADLIVEIADTTLRNDRTKKLALYAAREIPEYWIVNLVHRCVEVYRRPLAASYTEIFVFNEKETVSPLGKPKAKIAVADLLP
jgi:Uma2 family endonuclease